MRVAITGATGLLGRNLLFEFVKQHLKDPTTLELLVLGRPRAGQSLIDRVETMLIEDGADYVFGDREQPIEDIRDFARTRVRCLSCDFDRNNLGLDPDDIARLQDGPIDLFFHVGAMTDFRDFPAVVDALERTNVRGTEQLLRLVGALDVHEFSYVSSAYCCGLTSGTIAPNYVNLDQRFRNPYEISKLKAELLVRRFARDRELRCRIFRPSTICGRLVEHRLGSTCKFDVFYAWVAFFLRLKMRMMPKGADKYLTPVRLDDLRICFSLKSGLNIIPADYAAKVMYQVCVQHDPGEDYHLVNHEEIPHELYISYLLSAIGLSGWRGVDTIPLDKNPKEGIYYRHVGSIFTPYITCDPMLFDVANLESVFEKSGLRCPPLNTESLDVLVQFAREHDFGLRA